MPDSFRDSARTRKRMASLCTHCSSSDITFNGGGNNVCFVSLTTSLSVRFLFQSSWKRWVDLIRTFAYRTVLGESIFFYMHPFPKGPHTATGLSLEASGLKGSEVMQKNDALPLALMADAPCWSLLVPVLVRRSSLAAWL